MRNAVDQRQHLRLIDFEIRFRLAMAVEVFLRFPSLDQHEKRWFVLRMVDLEPRAARLLPGKSSLLDEQFLDLVDVRCVFDCQKHVAVNHGVVSVVGLNTEYVKSCGGGSSAGWRFAFAGSNVASACLGIFFSRKSFNFLPVLRFIEQFFDERDAPATARARTVALADLAGSPRFVDADEVADLPFGHVEAVANLVVWLH